MPVLPTSTANALASRAKDLLRDAAELTSGRDPNYIRDAQPESIFEAIPLAAARQGCRRYAERPEEYSGSRQARVERACRPYLDSLNYGEGPTIELPFRGGQCPVDYVVSWEMRDFDSQGNFFWAPQGPFSPVRGPLSVRDIAPAGQGPCTVPSQTFSAFGLFRGSTPLFQLNSGCTDVARGYRNLTITPITPGSDNCGSPPPEITYPGPRIPPGPTREPFVRSPDVNIDIGVELNPDLTINVDFGTGPITIDPFGDEPVGGGGGTGAGPGSPGSPVDTGQGGDADGEAPEGQILTGLRIDFVEPPVGGNEYAPGVYRGVCYIYMGTADGLDHDPAGAMLKSGQFVYAEKDFLTRWSVSANAGYNLRVTPYYRPAEAEE